MRVHKHNDFRKPGVTRIKECGGDIAFAISQNLVWLVKYLFLKATNRNIAIDINARKIKYSVALIAVTRKHEKRKERNESLGRRPWLF